MGFWIFPSLSDAPAQPEALLRSLIFFDSKDFAFSSSAPRLALSPRPERFMKYVSIRMPEPGPLGETFFEARALAIVVALFVNNPAVGCVESVFTLATHLSFFVFPVFVFTVFIEPPSRSDCDAFPR
jgi:hypothetical protein